MEIFSCSEQFGVGVKATSFCFLFLGDAAVLTNGQLVFCIQEKIEAGLSYLSVSAMTHRDGMTQNFP